MKKLLASVLSIFAASSLAAAPPSPDSVEFFVQQSVEGLRAQTSAHAATWHFGKEQTWSVDQDRGVIQFIFEDGVVATAPVQIIGTYSQERGTFLWGWDHPSVVEPLRRAATLVHRYGVEHNIRQFTQREVRCTEAEAWEFTAVAARLDSANGAYRSSSGAGGPLVYMTFGEVKLAKQP